MITLHVHDGKRVRSTRVFPQALIDDFIARLLGTTKDEASGHEFHGNQWTGGLGAKPVPVMFGSVKQKLMQLLAQGHSFTLAELAKLLGQSEVTLRGRLSEIKKATAGGQLYLAKQGNNYFLAQKEAAPDYAKEAEQEWVKHANAEAAAMGLTPALEPLATPAPPEPVAPAPEPVVAAVEALTTAQKLIPEAGTFLPVTSTEKNALYEQSLKKWADDLTSSQFATKEGVIAPETINALATGFKQNKTNAMAQWKATTDGESVVAKAATAFKADEQYVKDLLAGNTHAQAYAAWKQNTANEKKGTWPPDPFAEAKKAEAAKTAAEAAKIAGEQYLQAQEKAKAEKAAKEAAELAAMGDALKEYAPSFDQVPDYVPSYHVDIGMEDFIGSSPIFSTEIGKLKAKLGQGHTDSIGNKVGVQAALEARLLESKAFQALKVQSKNATKYDSLAATLISAWAGSSGDHQPVSVANQLAIRDAFAMQGSDIAVDALHLLTKTKASEDEVYAQAASSLGCRFTTDAEKTTFRSGLRDFALAQYRNTQEHFKKVGVEHVYVARGSAGNVGIEKKSGEATHGGLKLQPASSFSANYSTAAGSFSKGDSVYMVKVPASQVLSSYVTGFGCTGEHEVVVLAHPKMKAVRVSTSYGNTLSSAVSHTASTMKNAPAPSEHALAVMEEQKAKKHAAEHKQSLIDAKAGGPAPVVPKYSKYTKTSWSKTAYAAAKKGDVEAVKKAKAEFDAYKAKSGLGYNATTQYFNGSANSMSIVEHAEKVAAHKEAVAKAKTELKAEAKAAKVKKPTVHVHVHSAAQAHVAVQAPEVKAAVAKALAEHPNAFAGATPEWFKAHPMHNETKYWSMVTSGKTPIQIKHYYGSLKHAAAKKAEAHA